MAAGGQGGKEKDGGRKMLDKEIVIDRMRQGGTLEITAHFETVAINGRAVCDRVIGTQGKEKLRAKFGSGIKAVFLLEEYGETWEAEEAAEETGEQETGPFDGAEAAHTDERKEPPEKRADSGRKTHLETVQRWRAEHPAGSKKACARETGLSLPTIRRHWNGENAKERTEGAAYENDGSDSRGGRGHKVRNI